MVSKHLKEVEQSEKLKEVEQLEKLKEQSKDSKDQKDAADTKPHKDNKDQKDHKEQKDQKEQKEQKEKHEKEQKHEHKEKDKEIGKEDLLEKLPTTEHLAYRAADVSAQPAGITKMAEQKQLGGEKLYVADKHLTPKEVKFEKYEIKELKIEYKDFIKEIEKLPLDKVPYAEGKGLYEGPVGGPGDPYAQRIANLEAAVSQLLHFIPENLRPDLSQGALKQEADVAKKEGSGKSGGAEGAAKEDKGKR